MNPKQSLREKIEKLVRYSCTMTCETDCIKCVKKRTDKILKECEKVVDTSILETAKTQCWVIEKRDHMFMINEKELKQNLKKNIGG